MQSNIERIRQETNNTVTPESVVKMCQNIFPFTNKGHARAWAIVMLASLRPQPTFFEKYDWLIYCGTVISLVALFNLFFI